MVGLREVSSPAEVRECAIRTCHVAIVLRLADKIRNFQLFGNEEQGLDASMIAAVGSNREETKHIVQVALQFEETEQ